MVASSEFWLRPNQVNASGDHANGEDADDEDEVDKLINDVVLNRPLD